MKQIAEVSRPPLGRIVVESLCVAGVTLAYLWLWRLYGFDVVDEGTQLLQISRAAAGALPYTDFETGYTPGYFTMQSWLWQSGGFVAIRTMLVVVHAGVAATVYALLRDSGGRSSACVGVAMFVAYLLPVSLNQGAPLNIPYPGWIALPAVLMSVALLAELGEGHSARRDSLGIFLAGVGAAFAFAVKPNTGLFLLGGAALAVAASWRTTHAAERWCSWLLRSTAALAVFFPGLSGFWFSPGSRPMDPRFFGSDCRRAGSRRGTAYRLPGSGCARGRILVAYLALARSPLGEDWFC